MAFCKYRKFLLLLLFSFFINGAAFCKYFAVQADPRVALLVGLFLFDAEELEANGVENAVILSKKIRQIFTQLALDEKNSSESSKILNSIISEGKLKLRGTDLSADLQKAFADYAPIWKKHTRKLEKLAQKIPLAHRRCRIDFWLPKLKTFFSSDLALSDQEPFENFLFTFFKNNYGFSLEPRLLFIQEAPYNEVIHMGVVIHETCHLFYKAMSEDQRNMCSNFFKAASSPYAFLVENYLDETLATCIGNRIIVNQVNKKYSKEAYNNPYINGYSEVLEPLVKDYLVSNKSMDANFLKEAIYLFEKRFPEALNDFNALLFSTTIFSDFAEDNLIKSGFLEKIQNIFSCGAVQFFSIDKKDLNASKATRRAVILLLKNSTTIKGITLPQKSDTLYLKHDGKKLNIIIKTDDLKKAEKAISFLKKNARFKCNLLLKL